MSLVSIIQLTALVLNTVLGLFVFLARTKTEFSEDYFALVVFVSLWIFTNYLVGFVTTQDQAWLLSTVAYASILGIAYAFLLFSHHFPAPAFDWSPAYRLSMLALTLLVGVTVFLPGFVIQSIVIYPWRINTGPGINLLFAYFLLLLLAAFTILARKLRNEHFTGQVRLQMILVLVGTATSAALGVGFNLLLPYMFHNYDYVQIGPVFTLVMVASVSVAIARYHLFNIKVIATQIFSSVLCTALFVRMLAAATAQEQLIDAALFVLTLVVCILLVRSVLKEVEQRDALAIANQNQSDLIHIMNHQIKGRLGAGKNAFAELLSGDYGPLPPSAVDLANNGFAEMETGVRYIQTILQGMNAENGSLSFDMRPLDFRGLLSAVVAYQRLLAEKKGLIFNVKYADGDYTILGDALQLTEAIRNLIDNAINYTPSGTITVALQRNTSALLLIIQDTGVGIPEEDRPKLFRAGGHGKNSSKVNVNSTGYGLAFVKGVVEAHHGSVSYESVPGQGTAFFLTIPVLRQTNVRRGIPPLATATS